MNLKPEDGCGKFCSPAFPTLFRHYIIKCSPPDAPPPRAAAAQAPPGVPAMAERVAPIRLDPPVPMPLAIPCSMNTTTQSLGTEENC